MAADDWDPAIGPVTPRGRFRFRRAVTPDAGYGGVGVNVDLLVPNHRGHRGEAAMVAAGNERTSS